MKEWKTERAAALSQQHTRRQDSLRYTLQIQIRYTRWRCCHVAADALTLGLCSAMLSHTVTRSLTLPPRAVHILYFYFWQPFFFRSHVARATQLGTKLSLKLQHLLSQWHSLSHSLSTCCVIVSVSSNRRSIRTIACLPLALGIFHCVSKFKLIFLIAPLSRYRSLPLLALSLSFSLSLALSF